MIGYTHPVGFSPFAFRQKEQLQMSRHLGHLYVLWSVKHTPPKQHNALKGVTSARHMLATLDVLQGFTLGAYFSRAFPIASLEARRAELDAAPFFLLAADCALKTS